MCQALLNAVFLMNGKTMCFQGGHEHKALKLSQFMFGIDEGSTLFIVRMDTRTGTGQECTRINLTKSRLPSTILNHP